MKMKLYVAGAFDHREEIQAAARCLEREGHGVTSNWLSEPPISQSDPTVERWEKRARAHEDIFDIERADGIVVFTEWPSLTGGYPSEFLLAWHMGKELFLIGGPINIFMELSEVHVFEGVWDLIDYLKH